MKIVVLGGGPAGLYFAIQMKKADPAHHVTVIERNSLDATFGFGVVFSDATQDNLAEADRETYEAMARRFHHWDDIDVHCNGTVVTSTGHGFSGLSRRAVLPALGRRPRTGGGGLEGGTGGPGVPALPGAAPLGAGRAVHSHVRAQPPARVRPTT